MRKLIDEIFVEQRINFLRLYKIIEKKDSVYLYDVQDGKIFAYPFTDFVKDMSHRDQEQAMNNYPLILSGSHMLAFVRDNERKKLTSTLIEIDQTELNHIKTPEVIKRPIGENSQSLGNDFQKEMDLIAKIKTELPLAARPNSETRNLMSKQGIVHTREVKIEDVTYLGDEGGISCQLRPFEKSGPLFVVSLTHLVVDPSHPLSADIMAYQIERMQKLKRTKGPQKKSGSFTVSPQRKKKKKMKKKKKKKNKKRR